MARVIFRRRFIPPTKQKWIGTSQKIAGVALLSLRKLRGVGT